MVNKLRRKLLKSIAMVTSLATPHSFAALLKPAAPTIHISTLQSFLDVLIPRDSTPSASDINIDQKLIKKASGIDNYHQLLVEGTQWLNVQSLKYWRLPFHELSDDNKEKLVDAAFNAPVGTLPQVFMTWVRDDAMQLYYSDPRSWPGLVISTPPQPNGYPTAHLKPRDSL